MRYKGPPPSPLSHPKYIFIRNKIEIIFPCAVNNISTLVEGEIHKHKTNP